jgi:hypothetical protein
MRSEVFINYRRSDVPAFGALLYVELVRHFGTEQVFMGSLSIPAGCDFAVELLARVRCSRVLLAVIGPGWLAAANAQGGRRLDDPQDWVRRELAEAFATGVRVIPVLVDGARLPREAELPADIAQLARCQYRWLRSRDVLGDLDRLRQDVLLGCPALARRGWIRELPAMWAYCLAAWAVAAELVAVVRPWCDAGHADDREHAGTWSR